MLERTTKACCLALALGALTAVSAHAVPVTTTVNSSIDIADPSNPLGLTTSDTATAVAVYDDSLVPGTGAFTLQVDSDPAFSLTITLGSFVFTEADDVGAGFPRLLFQDGALVGLNFLKQSFPLGSFADLDFASIFPHVRWELEDFTTSTTLLGGAWDFDNAQTVPNDVTVVPEPATWLLLAGGLFSLVGAARRKAPKAR
jgi:PEP-CTERM motif